jgi:hypothetical protein
VTGAVHIVPPPAVLDALLGAPTADITSVFGAPPTLDAHGALWRGSEGDDLGSVYLPWVEGLDPAAAVEMLEARGLIPERSDARAFYCEPCAGSGSAITPHGNRNPMGPCPDCTPICAVCDGSGEVQHRWHEDDSEPCDDCGGRGFARDFGTGHHPLPQSLRTLALWSTFDAATAEGLAREASEQLAGYGAKTCTLVVWSVGTVQKETAGIVPVITSAHGAYITQDGASRGNADGTLYPIAEREWVCQPVADLFAMGLLVESFMDGTVTLTIPEAR